MTKQPRQTMQQIFDARLQMLATVLRPVSIRQYRAHLKRFLSYLEAAHPDVCRLSQLRRDPHMIGWLRSLHEHLPPLANKTRLDAIILVRRLLNDLAANHCCRVREGLLIRGDCPPVDKYLPKPLSPEDDYKLEQQLRKNDDLCSNGLLLLRATGMRIGECLNLTVDALRDFGQNQWAIKIPLGKLHNERWVPVDEDACGVFRRILSLRSLVAQTHPGASSMILLLQKNGRPMTYLALKGRLIAAGRQAGCASRTTPHRLRHTYGTAMLRAGASLPAVMELLGHKTITMTLHYVEVNQLDLQREYHRARQQMRFPAIPQINKTRKNLEFPNLLHSLAEAHHLMEMMRRQLSSEEMRRKLARLTNRLDKIAAEMSEFNKAEK
jgi:site-specific recombinase XerD